MVVNILVFYQTKSYDKTSYQGACLTSFEFRYFLLLATWHFFGSPVLDLDI